MSNKGGMKRKRIFNGRSFQHLVFTIVFLLVGEVYAQKVLIKGAGIGLIDAEISPDGRYVALTSVGFDGVWTVRADGYSLRQFSNVKGAGQIKRWSPDSKWLLFKENAGEGGLIREELKIGEVYTGNISSINIPMRMFDDVRWFDSDKLYIRSGGKANYVRSGLIVDLKYRAAPQIAYTETNKMFVESYTGNSPDNINPVLGSEYRDAVLSEDGKMIAFMVIGGNLQVYELENFQLHDLGRGERPRWSPDGERLVYQITSLIGENVKSSDIYLIKFDGSGKTQMTNSVNVHEMRASFFPDGKKIIFDTDKLGEIRTMRVPRN
ncbi:MAG: PD40 domain-containing protein [Candidatus Marinimicrobia bacterium]|nr:PD40 domain-containing protein [Candidatus Neomarinimicrobiota bacterium]